MPLPSLLLVKFPEHRIDMRSTVLLLLLILLVASTEVWSFLVPTFRFSPMVQRCKSFRPCRQHNFKLFAAGIGNEVDISPDKDKSIMKTLLKEGSLSRSYPVKGDTVEVRYKIWDFATGALLHDSSKGPKNGDTQEGVFPVDGPVPKVVRVVRNVFSLTFEVGTMPLEVVIGWDIAVRTMRLGEIASFVMEPQMAFADRGLGDLVAPNTKLTFELELLKITPNWLLEYKTQDDDEDNEGVKAQLERDIESGDSPMSQTIYGKQSTQRSFGSGLVAQAAPSDPSRISGHPDLDGEVVSQPGPATASAREGYASPKFHPKTPHIRVSEPPPVEQLIRPDGTERVFYDPDRHQLDTSAEVSGQAEGYHWKETFNTMDIEIPLKIGEDVKQAVRFSKSDVLVDVTTSSINVRHRDGRPLLSGPLQGKINPHEVSWALSEYGVADTYKHKAFQCLQISLEKGAMYRDIWATVLNREYLDSLLTPEEKAARQAEFDLFNKPRPAASPTPPKEESLPLSGNEEMQYVDFDMDEEGNVINQTTGSGNGEDSTQLK